MSLSRKLVGDTTNVIVPSRTRTGMYINADFPSPVALIQKMSHPLSIFAVHSSWYASGSKLIDGWTRACINCSPGSDDHAFSGRHDQSKGCATGDIPHEDMARCLSSQKC
jgi:hypothetical protein